MLRAADVSALTMTLCILWMFPAVEGIDEAQILK